jgi:hypothetical protein
MLSVGVKVAEMASPPGTIEEGDRYRNVLVKEKNTLESKK